MTQEEQRLADDKMRAAIAKLIEETAKIKTERAWIPVTVTAAATAGTMALVNGLVQLWS